MGNCRELGSEKILLLKWTTLVDCQMRILQLLKVKIGKADVIMSRKFKMNTLEMSDCWSKGWKRSFKRETTRIQVIVMTVG